MYSYYLIIIVKFIIKIFNTIYKIGNLGDIRCRRGCMIYFSLNLVQTHTASHEKDVFSALFLVGIKE